MGILEAAKPAIVICTTDRARAAAFYGDTLGLITAYEDSLAAVFNIGGVNLRVSTVADFTPHEHTILGFNVPDVAATVIALREKGVTFNIYPGFNQDDLGICNVPGGTVRVAWCTMRDKRSGQDRVPYLIQNDDPLAGETVSRDRRKRNQRPSPHDARIMREGLNCYEITCVLA